MSTGSFEPTPSSIEMYDMGFEEFTNLRIDYQEYVLLTMALQLRAQGHEVFEYQRRFENYYITENDIEERFSNKGNTIIIFNVLPNYVKFNIHQRGTCGAYCVDVDQFRTIQKVYSTRSPAAKKSTFYLPEGLGDKFEMFWNNGIRQLQNPHS